MGRRAQASAVNLPANAVQSSGRDGVEAASRSGVQTSVMLGSVLQQVRNGKCALVRWSQTELQP